MSSSPIAITRHGITRPYGLDLVCSGYLVERGRVLLVQHSGFGRWVPPGGHLEPGETFAQAACREFREETGLSVRAVAPYGFVYDDVNARTEPLPFHVDVLIEGFERPTLTQYFFVERTAPQSESLQPQLSEVFAADWFASSQLGELETFKQVRAVATFALRNHPSGKVTDLAKDHL